MLVVTMTESTPELKRYESLGELFSAFGNPKRLKSYVLLVSGHTPKEITEKIDISRSGLQNYINDFKDIGLIEKDGRDIVITEMGEWAEAQLEEMETGYSKFLQTELMAEFEGIGGFASAGGREFVQQLLKEHPEEAKKMLENEDIDTNQR